MTASSMYREKSASPLPEFSAGPCCDMYQHATNAGKNDFVSLLRTCLGQVWKGLKDFADNEHLAKTRAVNAAATVIDVLKEVVWRGSKLTNAAYKAVFDCILTEAENIRGKRPRPYQPEGDKRRRSGPERTLIETDRRRHASEGSSRHSDGDRTRHSSDGGYGHYQGERHGFESDRYRYRY